MCQDARTSDRQPRGCLVTGREGARESAPRVPEPRVPELDAARPRARRVSVEVWPTSLVVSVVTRFVRNFLWIRPQPQDEQSGLRSTAVGSTGQGCDCTQRPRVRGRTAHGSPSRSPTGVARWSGPIVITDHDRTSDVARRPTPIRTSSVRARDRQRRVFSGSRVVVPASGSHQQSRPERRCPLKDVA